MIRIRDTLLNLALMLAAFPFLVLLAVCGAISVLFHPGAKDPFDARPPRRHPSDRPL